MLRQSYSTPDVTGQTFSPSNALLSWLGSNFAEIWKVTFIEPLVCGGMVVEWELRVHPLCKLLTCFPPAEHNLKGRSARGLDT